MSILGSVLGPVLDLDLGNQRLKWRCNSADGSCPAAELEQHLQQELQGSNIERIRLGSVGRHEKLLLGCLARLYPDIKPEPARVQPEYAGLVCGYEQPQKLGVDRWLALLAARQLTPRACVVDLGTAVTLDYLDNDVHLGGYIAPGLQTMRLSLVQNTRDIRLQEPTGNPLELPPGNNTADALHHGTGQALLALVLQAARGMDVLNGDWPLVLTGGDASWMTGLLEGRLELHLVEHLVLDGLAIALP